MYGYLILESPSGLSASGFPQITITLRKTDSTAGLEFYLAYFDPVKAANGYQMGMFGPVTTATQIVTFPASSQPFTMVPNQPYIFVLYSIPAAAVTPEPTASPVSSPSPAPTSSSVAPQGYAVCGVSSILTGPATAPSGAVVVPGGRQQ